MLVIAVFVVNGYVTKATSLDPLENVEIDAPNTDSEDARTKRSGDIFSSLVKKKLGLFSSLTGSSSGKSLGQQEHFEEPLVSTGAMIYTKIQENIGRALFLKTW